MILTVKTDSPIAEIGLWLDDKKVELRQWEAGRQLSAQLLDEIEALLKRNKAEFTDLAGLTVFKGPGSFTGLRIGATVSNSIAYAQNIPIVGTDGVAWQKDGLVRLANGENDIQVIPEYGAPANVTKPKSS